MLLSRTITSHCSIFSADADVRLARRIRRDTVEKGRDIGTVLDQVGNFLVLYTIILNSGSLACSFFFFFQLFSFIYFNLKYREPSLFIIFFSVNWAMKNRWWELYYFSSKFCSFCF